MAAAAGQAVVAVEIAPHYPIGKGGQFWKRAVISAENPRAFPGRHAHSQLARDPARLRVERRNGAAQRVNDAPLAFVHNPCRQAVPSLAPAVINNSV
jgi:hypothetical protein